MSVIDPGAAAPAPGAPAPNAAPPSGQQAGAQADPWGFAQHVAGAPEHLRAPLQTALDAIAPTLEQRFAPYQPLEQRMEQLTPLLEADEQGNTTLDGLLSLFELFNDPNRVDDFANWWEAIGDQFEFFGDDENEGGAGGAAAAQDELGELDPAVRAHIERLEARLGEFETRSQQTQEQQTREAAIADAAQAIRTELTTAMQAAGIDGHDNLQSPNAVDILRLVGSYGNDPKAVEKAVADFARMTGRAQASQLEEQGQPLNGVEALRAALAGGGGSPAASRAPGPSLGRGGDAHEPEAVRSFDDAKKLALQRFTADQRA